MPDASHSTLQSVQPFPASARSDMAIYRLGFIMEQTLGHVTHDRNLRQFVDADGEVVPDWMPIEYNHLGAWERLPFIRNNWSLRASLRARAIVKEHLKRQRLDGLFFHTQVTALFSTPFMRQIPTIVSLDATPVNMDSVGRYYGHTRSRVPGVEALKAALNRRAFRAARHLVTWNHWARNSLINDYGIAPEKITAISPGVDLGRWRFDRFPRPKPGPVRLLFVGGDFQRKGGPILLDVYRTALQDTCELDIVTRDPVNTEGISGVRVHHGLTANSPELLALYAAADIFVLPTLGECYSLAGIEALASELPLVISDIGATHEIIGDDVGGITVPPGDRDALAEAILRLVKDPDLRWQLGRAGRKRAEELFDGARNYRAIIALYKRCVDGKC